MKASRSGADAIRRQPDLAHSVHQVAVLHHELRGRVAGHLLDGKPRQQRAGARRVRRSSPGFGQVDGRSAFVLYLARASPARSSIASGTPNNGYAQKFKHVVEPSLTIAYRPEITNFNEIVKLDGTDTVLGTTRSAMRSRIAYTRRSRRRERLKVTMSQSYYTNENAATYDPSSRADMRRTQPTHFGPVILAARGAPTDRIQADFRPTGIRRFIRSRRCPATAASVYPTGCRRASGGVIGGSFPGRFILRRPRQTT